MIDPADVPKIADQAVHDISRAAGRNDDAVPPECNHEGRAGLGRARDRAGMDGSPGEKGRRGEAGRDGPTGRLNLGDDGLERLVGPIDHDEWWHPRGTPIRPRPQERLLRRAIMQPPSIIFQ